MRVPLGLVRTTANRENLRTGPFPSSSEVYQHDKLKLLKSKEGRGGAGPGGLTVKIELD